jgi:prenyltransferase beta subunit
MKVRSRGIIVFLLSVVLSASPGVMAQAREPVAGAGQQPNHPMSGDEITPAQQQAVEKGLALLASRQNPDGSWGSASAGFGRNAAITALGALAFMQAGNLPGRGRYGENVERALDFILEHTQESGLIVSDTSHGPMYGHGFATLFLAEVYGMTHDERVKEKLQRAVRLIHRTQNPEGGWRYQPVPYDADISVTITQVMALRAAHDAGIRVEREVVDRSIAYVRACQNADGGFSYMARHGGGSEFPRSAAGVAALYYAGVFEGDELERGLNYLAQFNPGRGSGARGAEAHYFYGHYYAVQAMFLAGEEYWTSWYPAIRDQLIARQNGVTGAWSDQFGEEYATAMSLIILQMPNRYLPVYTGKGPGD